MDKNLRSKDLIALLDLAALPGEGGYFRRTYAGLLDQEGRPANSVIYYLLDQSQPRSKLHWLPIAETYHFYLGDPVEMLLLEPQKTGRELVLGADVIAGQHVQITVPANCWHGSQLRSGGKFALLGTTMTPGYMDQDYVEADRKTMQASFPQFASKIEALTGNKK